MSGVARTRVSRVRFKSGGEVRVLPPPVVDPVRREAEEGLRRMLDCPNAGRPAGYAMVLWDAKGGSQCGYWSGPGPTWPVPQVMIPDYVRARLLLAIATQWSKEDTRQMMGFPPDGAS